MRILLGSGFQAVSTVALTTQMLTVRLESLSLRQAYRLLATPQTLVANVRNGSNADLSGHVANGWKADIR